MTAATGSQGVRAGASREWRFEATPPRRSADLFVGRQDTCTVPVRVRCTGHLVHFVVADDPVASTRRTALRSWMGRQGTKGPYVEGRLIFKNSSAGFWFEVEDVIAPTLLVAHAVREILAVLRD